MTKCAALLLPAALLSASAVRAETVAVRADWQKARTMLDHGQFRPRIAVELKSPKRVTLTQSRGEFHPRKRKEVELKPGKWIKGKLIEATGPGLQLIYREHEISFPREDIRRIRLVPRTKNRWTGLVLGIPAGIGAGLLASLACCFVDGASGSVALGYVVFIGAPIAVAYVFHKLWGGNRGAVVVVLEESTANNPPVPGQESGSSPAK